MCECQQKPYWMARLCIRWYFSGFVANWQTRNNLFSTSNAICIERKCISLIRSKMETKKPELKIQYFGIISIDFYLFAHGDGGEGKQYMQIQSNGVASSITATQFPKYYLHWFLSTQSTSNRFVSCVFVQMCERENGVNLHTNKLISLDVRYEGRTYDEYHIASMARDNFIRYFAF